MLKYQDTLDGQSKQTFEIYTPKRDGEHIGIPPFPGLMASNIAFRFDEITAFLSLRSVFFFFYKTRFKRKTK